MGLVSMNTAPAVVVLVLCVARATAHSANQPTTAHAPAEPAATLAAGWSALAQGRAAEATRIARRILDSSPRNAAAVSLAVEAEIVRGGSAAGLAEYELLLGDRGLEQPLLLRRIADGLLREAAVSTVDKQAVLEALHRLASAGDQAASNRLAELAARGSGPDLRTLAALGDERAVKAIAGELERNGTPLASLKALGDSGSPSAVQPLSQVLSDQRPEVRGAAAEALGHLDGPDLVDRLKPLLTDPSSFVRVRAAAALYRLGDYSGYQVLQDLANSDASASRLIAAEGMASRPDGTWQSLVRELTTASDPEVRLGAAQLIAPHDPQLARDVIQGLVADGDLAIREMAAEALPEVIRNDLPGLRGLLRAGGWIERVRAAIRILDLTD